PADRRPPARPLTPARRRRLDAGLPHRRGRRPRQPLHAPRGGGRVGAMSPLQVALVDKAERALATARQVMGEDPEAAVNRAYYACFYVAQAALLGVGERPKSHAGTHN